MVHALFETSLSLSSDQSGDADGRLDGMDCIYQLEISSFTFRLGGNLFMIVA